jgi:hypothetical protein
MLHVSTGLEHTPLFPASRNRPHLPARATYGTEVKALTLTPQNKSEVGIGLFPRSQDGAPPGCQHLSELLSNQKRFPLGDWPILAFDLSRPNSQFSMRLPDPERFSEGGNLCDLHRAGFLSVCVTADAPRTKSKSQEVESIVSHPLKFAEGWGGGLSWFDGREGQPSL